MIPERDFREPLLPPKELFQRFHALGVAIGSKSLAYWFYDASVLLEPRSGVHVKAVISTADVSFNDVISRNDVQGYHEFAPHYDTERARRYCDRYSLSYNDAPYIVYSEHHPDAVTQPDITIKLKGLKYDQYLSLLNSLEQALLIDRDAVAQLKTQVLFSRWRNMLANSKDEMLKIVELIGGFL